MKRYAFIDVQNTESTTNQLLGFVIDWHKMYKYLKENKNCSSILHFKTFFKVARFDSREKESSIFY